MTERDNPFADPIAVANSNYCVLQGRALVRSDTGQPPAGLTIFVHDALRALVLNDHYTCDGGKAAVRQGNYGFGLYEAMGSAASAAGLSRDLFTFTRSAFAHDGFGTFLASFAGPHPRDEQHFERLLWETLQQLHDADRVFHEWDPTVSDDPASAQFSFSFGGVAQFVIGLHAASSRAARRFAWPTLVFNPHRQFDELRRTGRYRRFQEVIRRAELALQGEINPMLSDHGTVSEAPQYSGRRVGPAWQCPFHSHDVNEQTSDSTAERGGVRTAERTDAEGHRCARGAGG